ncbi:MAG: 3-methyl-2-oxobutanoate dehydrogenase subunit VorB [Deltaproteobacteria bacterium]|nr:3-methyl-2-oxobutanoate dehydrogenase subunit VorB [Deltaproteobacteria bacterium]
MTGERQLFKGAEAIAEAAIRAGCRHFFGYPITPQNEIPEYMAKRMPEVGGTYLQAESELASIHMVFGGASTGARVMTSSSSPGLSLMAEGASYLVGAELPAVIVNIMRGGPGLGDIAPAQGDWAMMTRGWGHGDKRYLVLCPSTVQEAVELMAQAFDLAEKYRNPVVLLGDGLLGQMMEPVVFPEAIAVPDPPGWAARGKPKDRRRVIIRSLYLDPAQLETHVDGLFAKFAAMERDEPRAESWCCQDRPPVVVCAFGTVARIARTAIAQARAEGLPVGLWRPITAWPFAAPSLREVARHANRLLCIEMSKGQLVDDVRAVLGPDHAVAFWGRAGGVVPTVEDMLAQIRAQFAQA